MRTIEVPRRTLPLILYQRTEYLKNEPGALFLQKLVARFPVFQHSGVVFLSFWYQELIKSRFSVDMWREAEMLLPHIPRPCKCLLDIGAGVAGVDACLSSLLDHRVDLYLLDKTLTEERVYYHFQPRGSFYNSLDVARELLISNGVPTERIHLKEVVETNALLDVPSLDAVISLLSWGFHYPVDMYLAQVFALLRPGGVLILDVRKNTDGEARLIETFGSAQTIFETERSRRLCAVKPDTSNVENHSRTGNS